MSTKNISILVGIFIYILFFYFFVQENIYLGFSVFLGIVSFPFLITKEREEGGLLYLLACLIFSMATLYTDSFAIFYMAFSFGLCFLIGQLIGKFNLLPLFLLIIISPLISHVSAILSFPIRLSLSDWVSAVLSKLGMEIYSEGNLLILDGARFLVDKECVGLNMLITGLVLVLIVLSFAERRTFKAFNFIQISMFLLIGCILNILSNFSRILILVIYQIGPDQFMHDLVGILCLLFFVLLPTILLTSFFSSKPKPNFPSPELTKFSYKNLLIIAPFILLFMSNYNRSNYVSSPNINLDLSHFDKFDFEELNNNIKKYSSKDLLVYVKPPVSPIRGTHDPRFCWRGSGYSLEQIELVDIGNRSVYTGILLKGEDQIHTTWWYQVGEESTPSDWTWRTKSLFNSKSYTLLNFNSHSKEVLSREVKLYFESVGKKATVNELD